MTKWMKKNFLIYQPSLFPNFRVIDETKETSISSNQMSKKMNFFDIWFGNITLANL